MPETRLIPGRGYVRKNDDGTFEDVPPPSAAAVPSVTAVPLLVNPVRAALEAQNRDRQNRTEDRADRREAREQERYERETIGVEAPGDTTLTGDAYLATLPPGLAAQVKAMADGRRAFPTGAALRNFSIAKLVAAATQYDPALDAANAATRVATRKNFTSGKARGNITAINTALGHIGTLSKKADALDNKTFRTWNTIGNAILTERGDPRVKDFGIARDAVANELMRVFRQVGASTTEIEEWKRTIDSSDSPAQLKAEIGTAVDLLNSRLLSMQDEYQQGMGKSADVYEFLTPHAKQVFNALAPGGTGVIEDDPETPPPADMRSATGKTRRVPRDRANAAVNTLITLGKWDTANAVLKKNGSPPVSPTEKAEILKWQRANPGKAWTGSDIGDEVPTTAWQRALSNPELAPVAAGLANYANTATAGLPAILAGADAQGNLDAASAANPGAALTGSLFGGVTGAVGGGMTLAPRLAARLPAWLAPAAPTVVDASFGGLLGYSQDGLTGAAKGAGAAVLGSGAGNLLGRAFGAGKNTLNGADKAIYNSVKKELPEAQAALADASRLGVPFAIADAARKSRMLAGSVTRKSVDARDLAEATFDPRALNQGQRATDAINAHLAPVTDIAARNAEHLTNARTASNPLYAAAKANPAPDIAANPALNELLRRPSAEAGLRRAYGESLDRGANPAELSVRMGPDGQPILDAAPNWETIHAVRRGLDAEIESAIDPVTRQVKPGMSQAQGAMIALRRDLDEQIGILNPQFKEADAAFAGHAQQGEALNRGFAAAPTNIAPRDMGRIVNDLTPAQLPEYQRGYATGMNDIVQRTQDTADPFRLLRGSSARQDKIATLFPEGAQDFGRIHAFEKAMGKTHLETLGGSQTAGRTQADDQLAGGLGTMAVDAASSLATGGGFGLASLARAGVQGLRDGARLGFGQQAIRRADEIAPNLFNTNPAEAEAYLADIIARTAADMARRQRAGAFGGSGGAGILAPLLIGQQ